MTMPGRNYNAGSSYRYGFNGKENDKDAGEGIQDYGMRIYDSRLGRFLSVDPIANEYPWLSTYQFAGNTPIWCIDVDGEEPLVSTKKLSEGTYSRWGYEVYTAIDEVTKQAVIIMNKPNSNNWYYLKANSDGSFGQFFEDKPGSKIGANFHWQKFKTAEQIHYEETKKAVEQMCSIIVGAIVVPLTMALSPEIATASLEIRGASLLNDIGSQVLGNLVTGKENPFTDINLTSASMSFINPGSNLGGLVVNNTISSAYSISSIEGKNGIENGKDFSTVAFETFVGTAMGKVASKISSKSASKLVDLEYAKNSWEKLGANSKNVGGKILKDIDNMTSNLKKKINKVDVSTNGAGEAVNNINEKKNAKQ